MLDKLARRGTINILLVLFLILEIGVFPYFTGQLKAASGGSGMLDASLFLSPDQTHQMVGAYGDAGRNIYATDLLTADLLFPVVYALLLSVLIRYLFHELYPPESLMQRAVILPFAGMVFDYAENVSILALMAAYPQRVSVLEGLLPLLTAAKWGLIFVSFGTVLFAVIVYLKRAASRAA